MDGMGIDLEFYSLNFIDDVISKGNWVFEIQ